MELTAQSGSVIYLWLMQFLFGFVPWLVLALGIAAAALAFERFESMVKPCWFR